MKLGLSSWACAWAVGVRGFEPEHPLSACDLIRTAAGLGVRLVQIADNLPLDALDAEGLRTVASLARDLGIAIEAGTRGIAPDHLRRYLEICDATGSRILRVVIDTASHRPAVAEIIDTVAPLMPEFPSAGVVLAIENHDRFDARTFANIIDGIGSEHAGICLDTVNSFGALEGPDVVIGTLAAYTVNLHLKDFVVRRHPSMMGFEIVGAPAGQGRLDIPALLATMRANGRNPNAVLEQWPTPEANVAATVAKERDWMEQSLAYLRTQIPE